MYDILRLMSYVLIKKTLSVSEWCFLIENILFEIQK